MTSVRPGARVCARTGLVLVPAAGEQAYRVVEFLRAVDQDWAEHLPRAWRTARLMDTVAPW
jgi:hypothetical protein